MEIWKNVLNYEGRYQVSNLGRIKSLLYSNSIILKPHKKDNKYLTVRLSINGNSKTRTVHQLVAEAFLNHIPCGHTLVVNHINLNKLDNRVKNLEITTQRKNANHKHLKSFSNYTGVTWTKHGNTWISRITINNKLISLGRFKNEKQASIAYQEALTLHLESKSIQPIIDKYAPKFSSKYKGVSWNKCYNKWISRRMINGKVKFFGYFDTEHKAYLAYEKSFK